jgi:hypothetical protein
MRIASTDGAGWTVETVELALTSRRPRRNPAEPLGDGAQLCVRRHGRAVAYCASPEDLAALGLDMSKMAVVARWLTPNALAISGKSAQCRQAPSQIPGRVRAHASGPTVTVALHPSKSYVRMCGRTVYPSGGKIMP